VKVRKRRKAKPHGLLIVRSAANDMYLFPATHYGDWDLLAKYLEHGGELTEEMRAFVVHILRGVSEKRGEHPKTRTH
jgi:hypothetical protein